MLTRNNSFAASGESDRNTQTPPPQLVRSATLNQVPRGGSPQSPRQAPPGRGTNPRGGQAPNNAQRGSPGGMSSQRGAGPGGPRSQAFHSPQRGSPGQRGRGNPGNRGGLNRPFVSESYKSTIESSPEQPKQQESNDELDKKRFFVVKELVETERTYYNSLKILVELYVEPLGKAASSNHVILPQDQMYIFDNLSVMANISGHLLEGLEKCVSDWEKTNGSASLKISEVLKPLLPFMKMYASYRNQVDFNHLKELYEQHPRFDEYCAKMQSEPRSGGQILDSLLIMPIQRIPRYILLIETYLKYTDPSYGDYEGLQATLALVKEVAGHVNSAHAELDNTMFTLCMRLGEEFSKLMEPWRTYIGEVKLKTVTYGTKKSPQICVVLLCDHIVFATKNKSKFKGKLELIGCWIINVADTEEHQNLFTIYNPLITYTFVCESQEQKDKWIELIGSAIEKTAQGSTKDARSALINSHKYQSKKGTDPFYNNPLKSIISQNEFNLLKLIVNEPDPIVEVTKERKEKKEKEKKKEESPIVSKSVGSPVITTGAKLDDRIKQYEQATKEAAGAVPVPVKQKKGTKVKTKHVRSIQTSFGAQPVKVPKAQKASVSHRARVSHSIIKQGELTKKGAFVKNWKDRYWILTSDSLGYFKSPNDPEPVGEIPLRGCEVRDSTDIEDKCYFELVAPFRTYYLRASSEDLCTEWAGAVRNQINVLSRGKIIKEGYLIKQGKVRKTWKKRLCVLDEENLLYYRQAGDTKPAGSILIKSSRISNVPKRDCGKDFCIGVDTGARVFWLVAENSMQADEWSSALNKVAR